MTEDTTTSPNVAATVDASQLPKNDAQAEQLEQQQHTPDTEHTTNDAELTQQDAEKKQRYRSREFIQRINNENAELRQRLDALERQYHTPTPRPGTPPPDGAPKLEQYDYDLNAFLDARLNYLRQQWQQEQQQTQEERQQQQAYAAYQQRLTAFVDTHQDFYETVSAIAPELLPVELQAAIIAHEKGPEIAYHLANNEDELWSLASMRPEVLAAAVERLAARLNTAPPAVPQKNVVTLTGRTHSKPLSNAPPPPPTVSGRSPTDIPPEKMTDEDWYARDVEKRRKR
ncbi:hypothetical protein [Xylella fastidiosa]|uniref:Scaffolding protein n=2 Tax=Xylella fastidiosa TaxID=2371 RepID=A0A9Q4MGF6_XYLFS|nr:hypothetical protein [Xylella fastidiosa]ERI59323.1 hypothetical protein M233_10195 [Xylella fastidiosa subsp. multiplex Griffin-1]ACA11888.1 hypothetical protein Xfasm12_0906 [Xylella fastidiosa M12]KAJ4852842.1 hypothetical protein XYFPCFBP8418_000820 [Xylella fastidiosa subsp. multiplex]KFA41245.1 hypothetical protein DF22_002162 [Xylella fastidiosa]MBE0269714.1 hypothetical protein [Xylella fastidiosa subsp. multiplex]